MYWVQTNSFRYFARNNVFYSSFVQVADEPFYYKKYLTFSFFKSNISEFGQPSPTSLELIKQTFQTCHIFLHVIRNSHIYFFHFRNQIQRNFFNFMEGLAKYIWIRQLLQPGIVPRICKCRNMEIISYTVTYTFIYILAFL